ncbi:helix-turn-helix domain-containing protein [Spirosoma panaciterrae]|uniref:helix-turn-helix domain-containing protein n=1 Tax=Spirosoma panaciterrae TaxID=496058 RepID=UPI00035E714E|nr:helix-turn-helix transcriptional regulator [Spirosoma panaciterrae]
MPLTYVMKEQSSELPKEQSRHVCRNLAQLTKQLKLTQEVLAAKTGYERANISRLFSGRFSPRLEVIFTVLQAINELADQSFTLADIDVKPSTE